MPFAQSQKTPEPHHQPHQDSMPEETRQQLKQLQDFRISFHRREDISGLRDTRLLLYSGLPLTPDHAPVGAQTRGLPHFQGI